MIRKCCICGGGMKVIAKGTSWTYYVCPICNWYSTSSNFEKNEFDYGEYYDKHDTLDAGDDDKYYSFVKQSEKILRYKFNFLNIDPDNFLDVGCSKGAYVEAFNNIKGNNKGCGVEISESKVREGKKRGLSLYDINNIPSVKYDFVYMRHVIEHVDNPMDFIMGYLNNVADNGVLCIETPNCGGAINSIINRNKVKEDRYMRDLYPPSHVCGFTKKTYKYIMGQLKGYGFKNMKLFTYAGRNTNWQYDYGKKMIAAYKAMELFGVAQNIAAFYFK